MHNFLRFSLVLGLFAAASFLPAKDVPLKNDQRIAKPAPIVAQTPFQLKVETKPRFPNEARPEASTPATEKSLSVTIQPEKNEFAGNGPMSFLVTLTNTSKTPRMVFGLEHMGVKPKLVVSNLNTGAQWSIQGKTVNAKNAAAVQLEAGKSKTYTVVVESNVLIAPQPIPRPIPFPQPIPFPAVRKNAAVQQPILQPVQPKKILPRRPFVVVGQPLPCGSGKCRAWLLLEFQTDPVRRYQFPTFQGKLATGTVDFEVAKAQPVVVPPVVGVPGPLTKERAIALAQTTAERALQANYQPVAGVKPAHQGNWIENAAKTATVTESNTAWTVAWTHFPKSGFSYNVKIDVNKNGGVAIREVFTSYSR